MSENRTPRQSGPRRSVNIAADSSGKRLDMVLANSLPDLSRTRIQTLIEQGLVLETGAESGLKAGQTITNPSLRVKPGQTFSIYIPQPAAAKPQAQAIPLSIPFEDEHLLVIDKPAGLVVHPAPGNPDRTLVNALLAHCGDSLSGIGGIKRPGIVHRLDKDTSGLMVVAKTDAAHHGLSEQFSSRRISRIYLAVLWGVPVPPYGEITGNIGRNPRNRKKMAVVKRGGKLALTRYQLMRPLGGGANGQPGAASLVECRLATGRTHQIRVHLASIGHAVIGDPLYGGKKSAPKSLAMKATARTAFSFPRQALHAKFIGFEHPITRERIEFDSELPNDINLLINSIEDLQSPKD
jgi:23S rRNA pseudouridine1911/1915/1917 synthase